ncbi:MAG: enoyl-CoA hydratase-related protein [Anaerovoracaceae bacterium]
MSYIKVKKEDGKAILSIDRPEALNALNRDLIDELDLAVESINADKDIKVLVIYSEKNFAAGADIKDMIDLNPEDAKSFAFSGTFNKIAGLTVPTIAVIEGYALGGGLELALACDLRIASEEAKLGFPETGLGIMPGAGGTARATRLLGESKAMELILLGSIIDGKEADRIGLVNKVSSAENLYSDALKWADRISHGALVALKTAKATIRAGLKEQDIEKAIEIEGMNWSDLFNTEDQKEGMKAFIEKRKPEYKDK